MAKKKKAQLAGVHGLDAIKLAALAMGISAAAAEASVLYSNIKKAAADKKGAGKKKQTLTTAEKYAGTDMPENAAPADPVYRDQVKRMIDCAICAPVLVLAAIPMAITAAAIKLDSPGPVLFRQKRLGLGGEEFEMLKFRSMCVGAEHTGSGVYSGDGDARVTRVGKFIRATSIDELPQLINILRGDMALIGPRPPLTYHPWPIEEYTDEQKRMFEVRPGITGWAQTHGRKDVEWHHRIELNVWYVDHISLALDLKIFFSTIFKVLKNEDNQNIEATLQPAETAEAATVTAAPVETAETAEAAETAAAEATVGEIAAETAAPEETAETAEAAPVSGEEQ